MRNITLNLALFLLCSALFAGGTFAADSAGEPGRESGKKNPLNIVYFGEQHLHTSASVDAFIMGNRKNDIDDALSRAPYVLITWDQRGARMG